MWTLKMFFGGAETEKKALMPSDFWNSEKGASLAEYAVNMLPCLCIRKTIEMRAVVKR